MRRARGARGGLLLGAVGFAAAAAAAQPATFRLPAPTGPHAVGTTSWRLLDAERPETLGPATGQRQVEVLAWYPAASTARGQTAPYLRAGAAESDTLAGAVAGGAVFDGVASVRTHAVLDAVPLETSGKLPVLLFSASLTGIASAHTALLEDLASFGYAVLQVVHPYETAAATLLDGRIVTTSDATGAPLSAVREIVAEWSTEEATLATVAARGDDAEQLRLLREYLGGLERTNVALRRWVDDARLVLDQLPRLPRESSAGRLAARLDTRRVGVFGHSFGGAAAGELCLEERRCRAVLNLDGVPQYGAMAERRLGKPLLMLYSARPARTGANDPIYRRSASPYFRADARDTLHLDFTDLGLWGGPLRERGMVGAIDPERATEITRTLVREFFDQELLERRSPLLAGDQSLEGVAVRRIPPP